MQLDEHFSRPVKEFVSLCLKKVPAEVLAIILVIFAFLLAAVAFQDLLCKSYTFRDQVLKNLLNTDLLKMLGKVRNFSRG